jgi:hypothetical protein
MATGASASDDFGLFVSPRAVDEVHRGTKPRRSLKYDVKEPLPTSETLGFIAERLAREGWTPVMGPVLPDLEVSSLADGWINPDRRIPGVAVHVWSARWRDTKANEVVYTITYVCPLEQHGLHSAYGSVTAWYYTAEDARRERQTRDPDVELVVRRLKQATPKASPTPPSK